MHYVGTEPQVDAVIAAQDKAAGMPIRGVHGGGGKHVPMTDDPQSIGWTRHLTDKRRHPEDKAKWAVRLLGVATDKLSVTEAKVLGDAQTAAVELDETWKPKEASEEPKGLEL